MRIQLALKITDQLLTKVDKVSDKLHIDRNELIIRAVKKYLLLNEIKDIRKKLNPIVKKKGFKSEKDIFNAIS